MSEPTPSLRERRQAKRTREILEAALAVLGERGYANASMDAIAERALLTRVGLYRHFPDKPSLVRALREWKLGELGERAGRALAGVHGLQAGVGAVLREAFAFQDENRGFFRVLVAAAGLEPSGGAEDAFAPFVDRVAALLETALASGEARPAPPADLALVLAVLAFTPSIKRTLVLEDDAYAVPPHLADLVAEVFLRGVAREG